MCSSLRSEVGEALLTSVYVEDEDRLWLSAQRGYHQVVHTHSLGAGLFARAYEGNRSIAVERSVSSDPRYIEVVQGDRVSGSCALQRGRDGSRRHRVARAPRRERRPRDRRERRPRDRARARAAVGPRTPARIGPSAAPAGGERDRRVPRAARDRRAAGAERGGRARTRSRPGRARPERAARSARRLEPELRPVAAPRREALPRPGRAFRTRAGARVGGGGRVGRRRSTARRR